MHKWIIYPVLLSTLLLVLILIPSCKKSVPTAPTLVEKVPDAPSNLQVTATSNTTIDLSWTDNSDTETGFKIYRETSSTNVNKLIATVDKNNISKKGSSPSSLTKYYFSIIATEGKNVTTYQDSGLSPSTRYYYRVYAYNSSGNSSGYASGDATTPTSGEGNVPNAPSNLQLTASSSTAIDLSWTDNSDNEDGFKIYRGISSTYVNQHIATVGNNVTTYQDSGLSPSTRYYYRVYAYNSSGNSSGYASGDATTPGEGKYTLTTSAWPSNGGTVTKDPDQSEYTPGTQVTLTATENANYGFTGWSGDLSGSANPVTIAMNQSKSITAVFFPIPVLSGPTTVTEGVTFSISWTFTWPYWLLTTGEGFSVEESTTSSTSGFSEISTITRASSITSLAISRSAGTYYYRVRAYVKGGSPISGWTEYSNVIEVTVQAKISMTRFLNNTSYPIISLKIDGVEKFPQAPQGILPAYYYEIELSPGSHSYRAVNGFWDGSFRFEMYTSTGNFTQRSGITEIITFNDPTINQLLTRFQSSQKWEGNFWQNLAPHKAAFRFYSNGTWSFYVDGLHQSSGNYYLNSRDPSAFKVTFSIGSYNGELYETFGYFTMRNGPADFPLIQYFPVGL